MDAENELAVEEEEGPVSRGVDDFVFLLASSILTLNHG